MSRGLLERAYRRLGPNYPLVAVVVQAQSAYFVFLATLVVIDFYVEMSAGDFARLYLAGLLFLVGYNLLYARVARRLLAPVTAWLGGERDAAATLAAWTVAASLPRRLLRRELISLS